MGHFYATVVGYGYTKDEAECEAMRQGGESTGFHDATHSATLSSKMIEAPKKGRVVIERKAENGKPVWKKMWVVIGSNEVGRDYVIESFAKRSEAMASARGYAERYRKTCSVTKRPVLVSGSPSVTRVGVTSKKGKWEFEMDFHA